MVVVIAVALATRSVAASFKGSGSAFAGGGRAEKRNEWAVGSE